jgi:hypothetical protein
MVSDRPEHGPIVPGNVQKCDTAVLDVYKSTHIGEKCVRSTSERVDVGTAAHLLLVVSRSETHRIEQRI